MNQSLTNRKKGFTLIELLIVIALVGLLSTLVVIAVSGSRTKAYDTRRLADISDIQKALELYHSETEAYPDGIGLVMGGTDGRCLSFWGFTENCPLPPVRIYLAAVPANPEGHEEPYVYNSELDGTSFTLTFELLTTIADVTAGYHVLSPDGLQ